MSKKSRIQAYRSKRIHHIIGLMSGTSLDGVDGVLVEIKSDEGGQPSTITVLDRESIAYTDEVRHRVNDLCIPGKADIADMNTAHCGLAHWNAAVVNALKSRAIVDIDVVGMHGQTVWHEPQGTWFPLPEGNTLVRATLQLGNPQVLAALTDLPVISDFRSADMAVGGQGAPLSPSIDHLLFAERGKGVAVQNIGGISNVTILPKDKGPAEIWAFDTGPGNMIIDAVVGWGSEGTLRYDDEGRIASEGEVDRALLASLMEDPYFAKKPPKSTGREVYGAAFTSEFIQRAVVRGLDYADIVATATAFTAQSIVDAYRSFVLPYTPLDRVVVCGGGARNLTLLAMLRGALDAEVVSSTTVGVVDTDREAMAFALLAHASMMGLPSNIPSVTGAQKEVVLGTITMGQL